LVSTPWPLVTCNECVQCNEFLVFVRYHLLHYGFDNIKVPFNTQYKIATLTLLTYLLGALSLGLQGYLSGLGFSPENHWLWPWSQRSPSLSLVCKMLASNPSTFFSILLFLCPAAALLYRNHTTYH